MTKIYRPKTLFYNWRLKLTNNPEKVMNLKMITVKTNYNKVLLKIKIIKKKLKMAS
jgi:hypothetical protein